MSPCMGFLMIRPKNHAKHTFIKSPYWEHPFGCPKPMQNMLLLGFLTGNALLEI